MLSNSLKSGDELDMEMCPGLCSGVLKPFKYSERLLLTSCTSGASRAGPSLGTCAGKLKMFNKHAHTSRAYKISIFSKALKMFLNSSHLSSFGIDARCPMSCGTRVRGLSRGLRGSSRSRRGWCSSFCLSICSGPRFPLHFGLRSIFFLRNSKLIIK